MDPIEFYRNLHLAKRGYHTGREAELQEQIEKPKSIYDILLWKAQRRSMNREPRKTVPAIGSMKRSFLGNGR